jgi:replicative DNA helicase
MGKTALALNIATYVATRSDTKGAVLIFSLEMSKEQLAMRMLTAESRIDSKKMRSGNLEQDDWDKLAQATDRLSVAPIYINDASNLTPYEVVTVSKQLNKEFEHGVSLVVVDYLQLMQGNKKTNSREQEIAEISRSLKGIAKDLDIPVVALSQLNRALESRSDKRPQLSDLRESGSIEQDADIILFIYRDEVYNEDTEKKGMAEIIIAKHRNGPTGMIELVFAGKYTKFASLSKLEPPQLGPSQSQQLLS